jgi:transcriptional regulator with XRE-family HTH domain
MTNISGKQITAARSLAGWTAAELAEKAGLSRDAVLKIEAGAVQPREGTLADIRMAFGDAGIEFIDRGVRWRDDAVRVLDGEDAYLDMLDDIYKTLHKKGGEVLWLCSSDEVTIKGEYEAETRLRDAGIRFRSLIEEGKNETTWPRSEYRQIPSRYFNHNLQVIYGDKVAQVLEGGRRVLLVHNRDLATTARNVFDLIWSQAKMPPLAKPEKRHAK